MIWFVDDTTRLRLYEDSTKKGSVIIQVVAHFTHLDFFPNTQTNLIYINHICIYIYSLQYVLQKRKTKILLNLIDTYL